EHADWNFISADGVNRPEILAGHVARLREATALSGRRCGALGLVLVIADETDEKAMAKWEHYVAGTDHEALAWRDFQAAQDTGAEAHSTVGRYLRSDRLPNTLMRFVGSYATIARLLDECAAMPGLEGMMLAFDDFTTGPNLFGERIQPLMRSRAHVGR
ncbi:MAG: pyrimidine utilization protein A, partial [Acetobacteraceae bacterium]|nr:pyrimidine utilization protein A [Acetobacteraceae bacterium]